MKEGVKYTLNPPKPEDLNPSEDYLKEFDNWCHFMVVLEKISQEEGIPIEQAILWDDLYEEAINYMFIDDDGSDLMFA